MDYNNKLVLAPMVRVGTLPLRLLAAEYGADITYGEEIIDHKLVKCDRIVNDYLGTIDVVEKGTQNVVFRTCPEEQSRVVFQMGTSDAVRALKAAQLVKVPDRPKDRAKWNEIADVVAALSIPVIANGDVFDYEDIQHIKNATGASSIMVARGALWNASVFSPKGKLPWEEVKKEYVRKSILWDNEVKSTKHTLKEMIMHHSCLELPEGKAVIKSETLADLAKLYGEEDYFQFVNENR